MKKFLSIILALALGISWAMPAFAANNENGQIACGSDFCLVVKDDGSLWAWGQNYLGQLGDGTYINKEKPVKIMDDVEKAFAGSFHAMALKKDGSLWAWGLNESGQLGDGTYTNRNKPIKVMEQVQYATGGFHISAAVKRDGSLWAWGENMCGTFGKAKPVKILDSATLVKAGSDFITDLKKDGSLWAWGFDNYVYDVFAEREAKNTTWMKILDDVKTYSPGTVGYVLIHMLKTDGSYWEDSYCYGNSNQRSPYAPEITANHVYARNGDWDMPIVEVNKSWKKMPSNIQAMDAGFDFIGVITENNELYTYKKNNTMNAGFEEYKKVLNDVVDFSAGVLGGLALEEDGSVWYITENQSTEKIMSIHTKNTVAKQPVVADEKVAYTSAQKIAVNGSEVIAENYLIDGNNYCKLRDIAYMVKNTDSAFDVGWSAVDNAVVLTSDAEYLGNGGKKAAQNKKAQVATAKVLLDGKQIDLKGYLIDGNNYFKLRDVMNVIGAEVEWNSTTATVDIFA